jgi:hypothetical protein
MTIKKADAVRSIRAEVKFLLKLIDQGDWEAVKGGCLQIGIDAANMDAYEQQERLEHVLALRRSGALN